jgi:hypothetical protein
MQVTTRGFRKWLVPQSVKLPNTAKNNAFPTIKLTSTHMRTGPQNTMILFQQTVRMISNQMESSDG